MIKHLWLSKEAKRIVELEIENACLKRKIAEFTAREVQCGKEIMSLMIEVNELRRKSLPSNTGSQ